MSTGKGRKVAAKKRKKPAEIKALEKKLFQCASSDEKLDHKPKLELKLVLELGYDTKQQIEVLQKRMGVLEKRAKELQSTLSPNSKLRHKVFGEKPNLSTNKHPDSARKASVNQDAENVKTAVQESSVQSDQEEVREGEVVKETSSDSEASSETVKGHKEREAKASQQQQPETPEKTKKKKRTRKLTKSEGEKDTIGSPIQGSFKRVTNSRDSLLLINQAAEGESLRLLEQLQQQDMTQLDLSQLPTSITISPPITTPPSGGSVKNSPHSPSSPSSSSSPSSPSSSSSSSSTSAVSPLSALQPSSPNQESQTKGASPRVQAGGVGGSSGGIGKPSHLSKRISPRNVGGLACVPASPPLRRLSTPAAILENVGCSWTSSPLSPRMNKITKQRNEPGTRQVPSSWRASHLQTKDDSSAISKIKRRIFSSKDAEGSEIVKRRSTSLGSCRESKIHGRRSKDSGRQAFSLSRTKHNSLKNLARTNQDPMTDNPSNGLRERKLSFADEKLRSASFSSIEAATGDIYKRGWSGKGGRSSDSTYSDPISDSESISSDPVSENEAGMNTNTDDCSVSFDDHTESEDANVDTLYVAIDMIEGRMVMMRDNSFEEGNFYCIFTLTDTEAATRIVRGGQNPKWNDCVNIVSYGAEDEVLYISVWLKAPEGGKEDLFLGCTDVPLIFAASSGSELSCWFFLEGRNEKQEEGPFGAVHLRIRLKELWEEIEEEEEIKDILCMIMDEKHELALLENLTSTNREEFLDNQELREEIARQIELGREKIRLLEEKLKCMDGEKVVQVMRAKEAEMKMEQEAELQRLGREIELEKRELVLHQAYSQVFRHNPAERLKFDEHIRKVKQSIRELEDKRSEVRFVLHNTSSLESIPLL